MLSHFDRIQLVAPDRADVAERWRALLDTEVSGEDKLPSLGALRTTLAVGTTEVELLEPDGPGPAADFLRQRRGLGPFGVGFQSPDLDALRARLSAERIASEPDGGRLRIEGHALGLPGLRVTVGPEARRPRAGLIERLYEVTYLVPEADASAARFAERFALDASVFSPIDSSHFGYTGHLTLFDADDLDRVEIIHPHDRSKTMGRFFDRHGESLYMCYGETGRSAEVRARALELAPKGWTGPRDGDTPDNQFLHHTALGGVMMGVSRTSYAWSWSGKPDRVVPA